MNQPLKSYIKIQKKFLTKKFCNSVIKELQYANFREHTFYDSKNDNYTTLSGDQELSITNDDIPLRKELTGKIWYAIDKYIKSLNCDYFKGWEGYSLPRFNRYENKEKMALHCDHISDLFDGQRKGIPTLSILGLLNEDYEGGEFIMFDNYEIKLKQGDLMIFPSNFLYPHKVEPVKKGVRYSYVSWVW